ncbi:MAG TPA: L-histidine N(alpha)-methyltransferase, partial [Usitatibacter sp.]
EMHLESLRAQSVRLGDARRDFAPGERIHTENSYKYHAEDFARLLRDAGFASVRRWASADGGYFVFFAA